MSARMDSKLYIFKQKLEKYYFIISFLYSLLLITALHKVCEVCQSEYRIKFTPKPFYRWNRPRLPARVILSTLLKILLFIVLVASFIARFSDFKLFFDGSIGLFIVLA